MADNSNNDEQQLQPKPNTMRAWLYTKAGRNLATAMVLNPSARRPPTPLPADRLLVRVTHMSPNPADYKLPELGHAVSVIMMRSFSATPGMDYAGIVEEVGRSVNSSPSSSSSSSTGTTYKPGDTVFGHIEQTPFGTLAEYIQPAPTSAVPFPSSSISATDASTLGTTAQTAYQALVPFVRAGAGDEVFINGGSGGVGTYAIQIAARVLGCVVTTSCSSHNASLCTSLGATTVLDYTTTDISAALRARGQVFRVVVDAVGSSPADLYKAADDYMLPDGAFVQVGAEFSPSNLCATASRALLPSILGGGKRAWKFVKMAQKYDDCVHLAQWMQEGKIRAVIDGDIFPFEDAPKAFEKLKTKHTKGNLVVKVSD